MRVMYSIQVNLEEILVVVPVSLFLLCVYIMLIDNA